MRFGLMMRMTTAANAGTGTDAIKGMRIRKRRIVRIGRSGKAMKIDEGCINHNAVKLIREILEATTITSANGDNDRIWTLGYVQGIVDFAEAMQEVLKC